MDITKKKAELMEEISKIDEKILSDPRNAELYKKRGALSESLSKIEKLESIREKIRELQKYEDDEEIAELAREESETLKREEEALLNELKEEEGEEKKKKKDSCIVEIRAGVGGVEASLFAGDLLRMYRKFSEKMGWTFKDETKYTEMGGVRESVVIVEGENVYNILKEEAGVHRVQRVPVTEASGRIHTSTATVAVLDEPEEVEIEISPNDIEIETFRASGPGGQYVNMTDTAVRIRHIPTGIVVSCQEERSQHMNKMRALRVLGAKLKRMKEEEQEKRISSERKKQIGMAMRSEKLRTYNFTQNRVTDHRLGVTIYRLKDILDGNLDLLLNSKR